MGIANRYTLNLKTRLNVIWATHTHTHVASGGGPGSYTGELTSQSQIHPKAALNLAPKPPNTPPAPDLPVQIASAESGHPSRATVRGPGPGYVERLKEVMQFCIGFRFLGESRKFVLQGLGVGSGCFKQNQNKTRSKQAQRVESLESRAVGVRHLTLNSKP